MESDDVAPVANRRPEAPEAIGGSHELPSSAGAADLQERDQELRRCSVDDLKDSTDHRPRAPEAIGGSLELLSPSPAGTANLHTHGQTRGLPHCGQKRTPETPERSGGSSSHPPPQLLTSPAMNGDGAPAAKRCKVSINHPPERPSADVNCDGAPPTKRTKNSSTAFANAVNLLEDLPDDLAVDILLRLSTADAARVSSLSRRCRKIRSLLPVLNFNCNRCPPEVGSISAALAVHDRAAEIRYLSVRLAHMAGSSVSSLFRHAAQFVTGELCFQSLCSARGEELDAMLDRARQKDQCSVDMPCFNRASRISVRLGFLSLKMPRVGCFTDLKVLQLACFGYHNKLVLSMLMFPVLQELSLKKTFGFHILNINSNSLKKIRPCKMIDLNWLMIMTPNLKVLNVLKCLEHVLRPMVEIFAPKLEVFRWSAPYNPLLTSLSEMGSLKLLNPPVITAFGLEEFTTNLDSVNMLRKFPEVEHLEIDMEVVAYNFGTHTLMQKIDFPKSEILSIHVKTNGHSSGASILHVIEMCSSIKVLNVTMEDLAHVQNRCPLMCSCYNPAGWASQRSQMISLKELTVRCLNGMNDEFKLLKVLLKLAPSLESVKLIVGPHFQCVRQEGKPTNFLDVSKNVFQEIQILTSLVPLGCTLEMYEHAYDNKSDDYTLVPLRFDNED